MRGLKSGFSVCDDAELKSHRSRGAWIEIDKQSGYRDPRHPSHRSRGAWIEIGHAARATKRWIRRIAHAVRGLKSGFSVCDDAELKSHRSRGAWIEIDKQSGYRDPRHPSHRSRGAWIEIGHAARATKRWIRRIAHAVRGLKCAFAERYPEAYGRIAHAVRGLKWLGVYGSDSYTGVASLTRCVD